MNLNLFYLEGSFYSVNINVDSTLEFDTPDFIPLEVVPVVLPALISTPGASEHRLLPNGSSSFKQAAVNRLGLDHEQITHLGGGRVGGGRGGVGVLLPGPSGPCDPRLTRG